MTVSQQLYHENENAWDDTITVTDVPKGNFLAITSMQRPAEGDTTRKITVELMELEQAPGGTSTANTNTYVRQPGETAVHVTVSKNGTQLGENTTSYPS